MPALTRLLLPLLLVALALPATAAAAPKLEAFDYVSNSRHLTQPKYETERTVVKLPAFDGKLLYIEIVRPKADRRFPVILEASPYHGTLADRDGTRIFPDPVGEDG